MINLYESPVLREVTGAVIRPGGFDLTDRGVACCRLTRGARVLDVGCGTGAGANRLRSRHGLAAMGLDLSAGLLREGARDHDGLPLVRGRAEALPVAGAAFDAVFCECVLSLCPEPQNVLKEFLRVLKPGGHLVLTDLYARDAGAAAGNMAISVQCCLQGAVDRPTGESRLTAAGFDLVLWEDHTALLRQLAAKLVWTYGSLDAFWAAVGAADVPGAPTASGAGGCRRPGYCLVVGRKPE